MEHADTNCVPVSQVVQGDGADAAGEKTGSASKGATSEELNASCE
jgi:hypothetical protein